ncbi:MAG: hypothetical protein WD939_03425 [Dehalococcoidia bacterium]
MMLNVLLSTLALAVAVSAAQAQESESGLIRMGDVTTQVGEQATAALEGVDLPPGSLRAWVIDVKFDSDVADATECASLQGGVCNAQFDAGIVRITGASSKGLVGSALLAELTFVCGPEEGRTDLVLEEIPFGPADSGPAGFTFPKLEVGSITCIAPTPTEEPTATPGMVLPRTGASNSSASERWPWLAGLLAALGLTALGAAILRQRRA